MLQIIKAVFFHCIPNRSVFKKLLIVVSSILLSCSMHSLFAAPTQTQTHMKKAVTHKKSTSHKKSIHSHTQKQHAHHKKHSIQKKHSLQHAQLRNPVMDNQERQESSEEAVQEKPLNHNLATVNLTHFTSRFPANFMHTVKKSVVDFVEKTVDNLHYSSYKLGGKRFDPARGVYIVDCSNFVDNILQNVYPDAYSSLVNSVGADNPASQHYFNFFHDLASASDSHWNKVNDVEQLQPGDILVFRYKNSRGAETGGHVMVVMEKPEQASDVFFVRVADSAPSRHSEDTRHLHESGIGIGTLLLKANPITGKPSAFAWGVNGYWNKNVKFAMARPVGIDT